MSRAHATGALCPGDHLAQRLRREAGTDTAAQVRHAFDLAFGRTPETDERDASVTLINTHGLNAFCRAMLNTNEFLFVH